MHHRRGYRGTRATGVPAHGRSGAAALGRAGAALRAPGIRRAGARAATFFIDVHGLFTTRSRLTGTIVPIGTLTIVAAVVVVSTVVVAVSTAVITTGVTPIVVLAAIILAAVVVTMITARTGAWTSTVSTTVGTTAALLAAFGWEVSGGTFLLRGFLETSELARLLFLLVHLLHEDAGLVLVSTESGVADLLYSFWCSTQWPR